MVSKLSFKGEKPKKRKSKSSSTGESNPQKKKRSQDVLPSSKQQDIDSKSWVSAKQVNDIAGPVLVTSLGHKDGTTPLCLKVTPEGKVLLSFALDLQTDADDSNLFHSAEPESTQQVFVLQPVDFDSQEKIYTGEDKSDERVMKKKVAFKTVDGTYLTASKDGSVSAKALAIGAPQTFTIVAFPDDDDEPVKNTWAIETTWNTRLSVTESADKESQYYTVAASEDKDDERASRFVLRIHAQYQQEYKKKFARGEIGNGKSVDESYISSRVLKEKAGRELTRDEIKMLKKAYAEGHLNEALLDLRQKSKTDTRCY